MPLTNRSSEIRSLVALTWRTPLQTDFETLCVHLMRHRVFRLSCEDGHATRRVTQPWLHALSPCETKLPYVFPQCIHLRLTGRSRTVARLAAFLLGQDSLCKCIGRSREVKHNATSKSHVYDEGDRLCLSVGKHHARAALSMVLT
jgi:hypothetical protein